MVLEAVMLCVDNSEWMRNGDYSPSRWESQSESAQYIATAKINGNPETTVGLLSMARNRIEVHLSPQRTAGAVMTALASSVKLGGRMNLLAALKTAQLALKNRPNKHQRQRIIVFVGSPIDDEAAELEKVGKLFKKNNIALDVINFGTENASNDNAEKLETLINAVNASDNSHLLNIPPGPHVLADLILTSPIVNDGGSGVAMAGVGAAGGGLGDMGGAGGIDPNLDPEMALALRMSMEEERARQQRAGGAATGAGAEATAATATNNAATTNAPITTTSSGGAMQEDDEEAMLARAIAMSMEASAMQTESTTSTATAPSSSSSSSSSSSAPSTAVASDADISNAMNDPDFLNSLLSSVTGDSGDVNDLLDQLTGEKKTDEKKKESDKK